MAAKKSSSKSSSKAASKSASKDASKDASKPMTKTQIVAAIAEETELTKKQVDAVLESLFGLIETSMDKKGAGAFNIPGIVKIYKRTKPAQPAREVTMFGETRKVAAKPAKNEIKVRALKRLKDLV